MKTKNAREIAETLDKVSEGKIKFPDGKPVETVAIDSWSVVWSVAQEVAAVSAEKRACKERFRCGRGNHDPVRLGFSQTPA